MVTYIDFQHAESIRKAMPALLMREKKDDGEHYDYLSPYAPIFNAIQSQSRYVFSFIYLSGIKSDRKRTVIALSLHFLGYIFIVPRLFKRRGRKPREADSYQKLHQEIPVIWRLSITKRNIAFGQVITCSARDYWDIGAGQSDLARRSQQSLRYQIAIRTGEAGSLSRRTTCGESASGNYNTSSGFL